MHGCARGPSACAGDLTRRRWTTEGRRIWCGGRDASSRHFPQRLKTHMSNALPPIAETISQGGRSGSVETSENGFNLHFKPPSEGNPQGLTPEHLFGAAWAACFNGAVKYIAKESGHADEGITVTARVQLQPGAPQPFTALHLALRRRQRSSRSFNHGVPPGFRVRVAAPAPEPQATGR